MSASLVGSEMCIRDRAPAAAAAAPAAEAPVAMAGQAAVAPPPAAASEPVSYTHLTLPTICSV
eukprot:193954-Alexandrium_andersonii.AAC.1